MPLAGDSFSEALRIGAEVFHTLKKVLAGRGLVTSVGDEGGFAPNLASNEEAIEVILEAVEKAGYKAGQDVVLCLDAAASEFYDADKELYVFKWSDGRELNPEQMVDFYKLWTEKYPIVSLEDGLGEDDWAGWTAPDRRSGRQNPDRGRRPVLSPTRKDLKGASRKKSANSILIKLNQIGTVTETMACIDMAHKAGFSAVVSPSFRRNRRHLYRRPGGGRRQPVRSRPDPFPGPNASPNTIACSE